jgi:hypothetical protein
MSTEAPAGHASGTWHRAKAAVGAGAGASRDTEKNIYSPRSSVPGGDVTGRSLRAGADQAGSCQATPFGSSTSASFGPHVPRG